MSRWSILLEVAFLAALAGCASSTGTEGRCLGSSICPIVIYQTPTGFSTYPDISRMDPNGTTTLMWTFADQTRFKFIAGGAGAARDGVELLDGNPNRLGFGPCFITANSKDPLSIAPEGTYYRCEMTLGAKFSSRYRVRFHSADGARTYAVDPTVVGTGSHDDLPATGPSRAPTVTVLLGQDAPLPNGDVTVVWDAGAGGVFRLLEGYVELKYGTSDYQAAACYISTDAAGTAQSLTPTRWYACTFQSPPTLDYVATYRDQVAQVVRQASGRLTTP